ncbi:MAG: class I SAM-dependent methyltransferase [Chromatiales bacterium]|nr:class I SAM-dependent methyltransferase [Chromatiales bacterium]
MTQDARLPAYIRAAVGSNRRPERDTARDALRRPGETLLFFGVEPGHQVGELNAGWGYFTGVLSGTVGEHGRVHAHTTQASIKRWGGKNPLEKRIARHGITNIDLLVGPMDAPGFPPGLDAVFSIMNYHDAVWTGANREAMNKAIFDALRSGGIFGIVDHAALPGRGTADCHELHRVERELVVEEVTAAGFALDAESNLLANPDDPCTGQVHDKSVRDRTHRFMLRFRKPGA